MKSEELKSIRKKAKLTQEQLAHVLGVSVHTVIAWEKGKNPINQLTEFAIDLALNTGKKKRIKTKFSCDWEIKRLGKNGKKSNTVVFTGFKESEIKEEILHTIRHELEKQYDVFRHEVSIKNFKMSKPELL